MAKATSHEHMWGLKYTIRYPVSRFFKIKFLWCTIRILEIISHIWKHCRQWEGARRAQLFCEFPQAFHRTCPLYTTMSLEACVHWRSKLGQFKELRFSEWAEISSVVQKSCFSQTVRNTLPESSLRVVLMEKLPWITTQAFLLVWVDWGHWAATQDELSGPPERGG